MSHIESQIEERRAASKSLAGHIAMLEAQIAELRTKQLVVEAELRAYEDALAHAKPRTRSKRPPTKSAPRRRALSEMWRCVLTHLANSFPEQVSGEDIRAWADLHGHDITPENLRSQMSLYKSKGWIASDEPGHYGITESGAQEIGVKVSGIRISAVSESNDADVSSSKEASHDSGSRKPSPLLSGTSLSGLRLSGLHGFQSDGGKT